MSVYPGICLNRLKQFPGLLWLLTNWLKIWFHRIQGSHRFGVFKIQDILRTFPGHFYAANDSVKLLIFKCILVEISIQNLTSERIMIIYYSKYKYFCSFSDFSNIHSILLFIWHLCSNFICLLFIFFFFLQNSRTF